MRILLVAAMVAGAHAICSAENDGNADWPETADNTPAVEQTQTVAGSTCANWTRNCGAGAWDAAVQGACSVDCVAEDVWDATPNGQSDTKACAAGFSGNRSRACEDNAGDGAWAAEDTSACKADCPDDGDWTSAAAGQDSGATVPCGAGWTGNQSRTCSADGTNWEDASLAGCTDIDECATEADDCADTATCADTDGGFTCTCDVAGEGGDGKTGGTGCVAGCAAADGYAWAAEGEASEQACGDGFTGNKSSTCTDGAWAAADESACIADCAASDEVDDDGNPDPVWSQTAANDSIEGVACGAGWSGTKSRACSATGAWEDVDVSGCTENVCTCADGNDGYDAETAYRPAYGADCDVDGKALCVANGDCLCAAAGDWPEAACGADGAQTCPEGQEGDWTRGCAAVADSATPWVGAWAEEDAIVNTCADVPEESESEEEEEEPGTEFECTCGDDAETTCEDDIADIEDGETACTDAGGAWTEVEAADDDDEDDADASSAAVASAVVALVSLLL